MQIRVGVLGGEDRHLHSVERRDRIRAEEVLVPFVLRMGDHGDAGGEEFGTRRRDDELTAFVQPEADVVHRALLFAVFDLGLRHCGLEVDVPHGRRFVLVDLVLLDQIEERELGDTTTVFIDRRVGLLPIDGEAETAPEMLVDLLVLHRDLGTGFDEVLPRDLLDRILLALVPSGLPVRDVRELRIAADSEDVLHTALGGKAVVVPTHPVVDVLPAHPLEADEEVLMRVAEHVSDVE